MELPALSELSDAAGFDLPPRDEARSDRDPREVFRLIYENNGWGGDESYSGLGSGLDQTRVLRVALPELFRRLGVRSVLDAPCGDFRWMSQVDLRGIDYTGLDIVPEMIAGNQARYGDAGRRFVTGDLIADPLPAADLVFVRDCLVHLTYDQIFSALANIARSGARYLLTTVFVERDENVDISTGDWRPLNLCAPPFDLPPPLQVIVEGCTENGGIYADKALALWSVTALPTGAPTGSPTAG
jgi:SAM-dependent methyltransferase